MKKAKLLLGAAFALPVLSLGSAYAETGTNGSAGTGADANKTTTTTNQTTDAATTAAELKKRIEERKTALKTKVDEVAKKRIMLKCKAAQTVVEAHGKSFATQSDSRSKSYQTVIANLQKLALRLKENGKDTTEVDASIKMAEQKLAALQTEFKNYQQIVTDLKALDCTTDPTGFQATLESARAKREVIRKAAEDLHTYLKSTVKSAFEKLKPATSDSTNGSSQATTPTNSDTALTSKVPVSGGSR